MHPIDLIKKELEISTLSSENQDEFMDMLYRMPENYIDDILEISKEDANFLNFLWSNYSKKKTAFKMHNQEMLDSILKEEKILLEEMNVDV